jgi:hypothetical protein
MLKVYYFPIDAETLTPVSSDDIEKLGGPFTISNSNVVSEVKKLFESAVAPTKAEHAFSNRKVRVKVLENTGRGDEVIAIVENEGVIRRGNTDRVLSEDAMKRLKEILEATCK